MEIYSVLVYVSGYVAPSKNWFVSRDLSFVSALKMNPAVEDQNVQQLQISQNVCTVARPAIGSEWHCSHHRHLIMSVVWKTSCIINVVQNGWRIWNFCSFWASTLGIIFNTSWPCLNSNALLHTIAFEGASRNTFTTSLWILLAILILSQNTSDTLILAAKNYLDAANFSK